MIPVPTGIWMQTLVLLVAVLYLLRLSRVFRPSETRHASNSSRADPEHSVKLRQIYPKPGTKLETDVDIIAIHGFDTKSPDTWIWKSKDGNTCVNWLSDDDMLPSKVGAARIFTCNWPSNLFEDSSYVQKTFDDFAKGLLASIEGRFFETKEPDYKQRPTIFIASCLGGVILIKALVLARPDYFKRAAHGIVFLAAPFSGTSFLDVAEWAEPGLRVWAWIRAEKISNLLYETKLSANLIELRQDFHEVCSKHINSDRMAGFYETGTSSLPRKLFPWLPEFLAQEKVLVSQESASLDVFNKLNYHPLDRKHSLMNKFSGPNNQDYDLVAGRIQKILQTIREERPLHKADAWINDRHYEAKRLAIERISGDRVPMETCFINLVVIEDLAKIFEEKNEDQKQSSSQFSLHNRLNIQAPEEHKKIDIHHLFDPREEGPPPRRILIRGHAGVGKSTLCKKIVYDFKESDIWRSIFARILWVPLRKLKRKDEAKQSLDSLLKKEFFLNCPESKEYAQQLRKELGTDTNQKTLFILDGLDEVQEGLEADHYMFDLLQTLLQQPAVIVTCRPNVSLTNRQQLKFDLELETIGFSPDQVKLYIEKIFSMSQHSPSEMTSARQKIDGLLALLQRHQLLQDLVRIPIQLDALCYIWADGDESMRGETTFKTMTSVYQAIVVRLWRKDIPKLQFEDGKGIITKKVMQKATLEMIEKHVPGQVYLLQRLAFSGMVTNTTSFEDRDWQSIVEEVFIETSSSPSILTEPLFLGQTLPRLSFWRASDPSSGNADYHFIHLTFQEYFAARYFVRQWKNKKALKLQLNQENKSQSVRVFLANHKYDARYDIFWRFVAGLLSLEGTEICEFFRLIEEKPSDLLDSVRKRLIMHCLSEVPPNLSCFCSKRVELQNQLTEWLSLEYSLTFKSVNMRGTEVPEACLMSALESSGTTRRLSIVRALEYRRVIPPRVMQLMCSWLETPTTESLRLAILHILQQQQGPLVEVVSAAAEAFFGDQHGEIQEKALEGRPERWSRLGNELLDKLRALAQNLESPLRWPALRVLGKYCQLDAKTIESLMAELKNGHDFVSIHNYSLTSRTHAWRSSMEKQKDRYDFVLEHNQSLAGRTHARLSSMEKQKDRDDFVSIHNHSLAVRALAWLSILEKEKDRHNHLRSQSDLSDVSDSSSSSSGTDDDEKYDELGIMSFLATQVQYRPQILVVIAEQFPSREIEFHKSAVHLFKDYGRLDDDTFQKVGSMLTTEHSMTIDTVLEILANGGRSAGRLFNVLRDALRTRLQNGSDIAKSFIRALEEFPELYNEFLDSVAADLSDKDNHIRQAAIEKLQDLSNLSHDILDALRVRAEDRSEDKMIRIQATGVILRQQKPDNTIHDLIRVLLQENDMKLRHEFLEALEECPQPDKDILDMVVEQLEVDDDETPGKALLVLQKWHRLNDDVLNAIAEFMKSSNGQLRRAAVMALRNQSHPRDCIIRIMKCRLRLSHKDEDGTIRAEILAALSDWNRLDNDILSAVLLSLDLGRTVDNRRVMIAAVKVLRSHPQPNDGILKTIGNLLDGKDHTLRLTALKTLGSWSQLSDQLLKAIANCLVDDKVSVSSAAFYALTNQTVLPFMVLEPYMYILFEVALRNSFRDHICWLIDEMPCLAIGARRVYWANTVNDKPGLSPNDCSLITELHSTIFSQWRSLGAIRAELATPRARTRQRHRKRIY